MNVEVLITCVNYADFLCLTLPVTRQLFSSVTVITAMDDYATQAVAQRSGIPVHLTDVWFKNGAAFNKAAALNECLQKVKRAKDESWILFLDADVLFDQSMRLDLEHLDKNGLYSIRRRMCTTEAEYREFLAGTVPWDSFPLNIPRVVDGKVWRHRPTSNPAALSGYFQLWYLGGSIGLDTLPDSPTAANYDVEFALSFPEAMRCYLEGHEVLHLGPSKTNWNGRISDHWRNALDIAMCDPPERSNPTC